MPAEQKKILIVEDEKPMAQALQLKLRHANLKADLAFDGLSALDILKKNRYDLIVLDLVMPKLDGFKVLSELKSRGNSTPVVVISNLGQEEDVRRVKALGAADYFVKSDTTIAKLVEHIRQSLSA